MPRVSPFKRGRFLVRGSGRGERKKKREFPPSKGEITSHFSQKKNAESFPLQKGETYSLFSAGEKKCREFPPSKGGFTLLFFQRGSTLWGGRGPACDGDVAVARRLPAGGGGWGGRGFDVQSTNVPNPRTHSTPPPPKKIIQRLLRTALLSWVSESCQTPRTR